MTPHQQGLALLGHSMLKFNQRVTGSLCLGCTLADDYSVQGPAGERPDTDQDVQLCGEYLPKAPSPLPPVKLVPYCLAGIERCQWTPDGTHVILVATFRIRMAIWSLLEKVSS